MKRSPLQSPLMEIVQWYLLHSSLHVIISLIQDGVTPLYVASEQGHSDVVNVLIRNGADINLLRNV